MKTIRTIQFVMAGLLLPFISFAQPNVYSPNNKTDVYNVKDTLEIVIPDNNKIIFIADSLDMFDKMNVDSLFQAVKQQMGGSFINTSDEHITKSFMLTDMPNLSVKPDSAKVYPLRHIILSLSVIGGLIRNEFAPGLSFILRATSLKKGGVIGGLLSTDMYYFFSKNSEGKNIADINTFVNAGLTFDNNRLSYGIGIGFGKQFEKPAFKMFTGYAIKNTPITICPELYIVDGFKKVFPGFTIRFF